MTTKTTTAPENASLQATDQAQLDSARTEGAKAEGARIAGILGCEAAKDRPKLAQHLAFNSSMSVEDAGKMLEMAGVETQATAPAAPVKDANADSAFTKAMNEGGGPGVGPNASAQEEVEDDGNDLGKNLERMGYSING